ncbi:MAG: hypothetical protein GY794_07070 [bacterium]|nr:hypothetical protein [bacterium]
MAENKEAIAMPEVTASVDADLPPVPSSETPKTQETPGSAAGHARTRLVLFVVSAIMFCCIPFLGLDFGSKVLVLGIILFLIAAIWHIRSDNRTTARFKQPIEVMPEWSSYSVDESRSSALRAVSSGKEWGQETEAIFVKYAQALAASGMDRETIAKRLAKTGLTHSGAIDICAEL